MDQAPPVPSFTASAPPHSIPGPLPLIDRLYAATLRRTIWPLMNIATGRSIHRKMRFLEQSQWWPRVRLVELQCEKLRRLIEHAYARVPFYRRALQRCGLTPADFTSLEALRGLPTVTKAMLKADPRDFLEEGGDFHRLVKDATGGSTNEPTTFFRTREQDSWHWALKYRMWGMAGYRLGQPYVNLYNMQRHGLRKRVQDSFLRNHAFYVFTAADQQRMLDTVLEALARPAVQYLAGCTTTIRILADYRASLPHPLPIHLRAVLSTGSLLTQRDRRIIETQLGAPMWDHYGLGGEGAHIAAECERKFGYHINVENLIVEPAEPETIDTGQPTEVLVTVLDNYAWPLIRYVTGDYAVFSTRTCPCGRGVPMLERIDGRVSEVLRLPNGVKLNTHYFSVILSEAHDIAQYQVEQTARDTVLLRTVWRGRERAESITRWIVSELNKVSAGTVRVLFEDVASIPPLRSGKHRFIIALPEETRAGSN